MILPVEEIEVVLADGGALLEEVQLLLAAYGRWIRDHDVTGAALERERFEEDVRSLPGAYTPPDGLLLAVLVNGVMAGCVALRRHDDTSAEVKRLFVSPGFRGQSLGLRLLHEVIDRAQQRGYRALRMSTLPFMVSAARAYRLVGFAPSSPYEAAPLPGARYFTLELEAPPPRAILETMQPSQAGEFERLNRAWLEEYFHVEAKDERMFRDPLGEIVAPGGRIFVVREGERVVGTCAVLRHDATTMELGKMAVDAAARGRGYGEWLVRAAIQFARAAGATRLFLLSDEQLRDALRLYERMGFERRPFPGSTGYQRGDVLMEMSL
jgi:GNAT superfamily N-acetyltransferase